MQKLHRIQDLKFEGTLMLLTVDGKKYSFDITKVSARLAKANQKQRNDYTISPSGYGIHWNQLDEDISVDGLLNKTSKYKTTNSSSIAAEPAPKYRKK